MRFTRVLLRQLRTPKDYQNPNKEQGVLTHTRNVEIIPKLPKAKGGEDVHKGRVNRVLKIPTPRDIKQEMECAQIRELTTQILENTNSYLNKEEEALFFTLLKDKDPSYKLTEEKSELEVRLEEKESRNIEHIIWKMRRSNTSPEDFQKLSDKKNKWIVGGIRPPDW